MKSEKEFYEMANADKPEELIAATQRSIIKAMRDVVQDIKEIQKAPGMTWEQIDFLFESFLKKKPKIYTQEFEN